MKFVYIDDYKKYYYCVLEGLMVDYKEQVFITDIKANMQYFIYYFLPKKRISNLII